MIISVALLIIPVYRITLFFFFADQKSNRVLTLGLPAVFKETEHNLDWNCWHIKSFFYHTLNML